MMRSVPKRLVVMAVLVIGFFPAPAVLAQPVPEPDPLDNSWLDTPADRGLGTSGPAAPRQGLEDRKAMLLKRLQQLLVIDQETIRCVESAGDAAALRDCRIQRRQKMRALMPQRPPRAN